MSTSTTPGTPTHSPADVVAPPRGARDWLWIALIANLVGNIAIILTGGLVRLTGSGLGCPTWPECTPGSLVPTGAQTQGFHKFIEFGNRMITPVLVVVALALLVLAAARHWRSRRRFVLECAVPLFFVLVQAVVGGIIVLAKLDPKTVSPHFLISLFLVANATYLLYRYREGDGPATRVVPTVLQRLAWAAAAVGGVVCVLGTAVTGSGPHSGDKYENLRFGFDPHATSWLHADSVMLFLGLSVALVVASRLVPVPAPFRRAWDWTLALSLLQGLIGYVQYFTGRPVAVVAVHLLMSALFTVLLTQGVLTARRR
ncbi:COX15/CtaA family protein [Arsenicicoccus sp. oral taxon 190]|uniref:COX15/CtaA family protein n=1 Tax=Arsenicicoccus sp. oral taxon 190 TaxID=1658671 RepID=UPI00067A01B6|nr:COX15/CtaA family protein [Arsenicicoccus sp. oral taxon 190]AKT51983.1 cytochrome oxidase assembly protein [Arsenicicoccus sp. oral taxon 190]